jgi:hypothetical protein
LTDFTDAMKTLGTCRKDDRKSVAAVEQTAPRIVLSLAAGSRHTAIKENALSALGGTIRGRALPMGEIPELSGGSQSDAVRAFSRSTPSLSLRSKDSVPRLKASTPHSIQ